VCAKNDANIIEVQHIREGVRLHARETGIQVVLEVKNAEHTETLINQITASGIDCSAK
jgi:threonine dehydratase